MSFINQKESMIHYDNNKKLYIEHPIEFEQDENIHIHGISVQKDHTITIINNNQTIIKETSLPCEGKVQILLFIYKVKTVVKNVN
jgi:hypothetical protein